MRKIFLLMIGCMLVLTACGRQEAEVSANTSEYASSTEEITSESVIEENTSSEVHIEVGTVTESDAEMQVDMPDFMEGIADKVLYDEDLAKWNNLQLEAATKLYTDFTICTIVKDYKYYRAIYLDNGVVIVDNDNNENYTIYYNGASLTVPMGYAMGTDLKVQIGFYDVDGEGEKELFIVESGDEYKTHVIRLEPLELILCDFDMNTVIDELIADYGLSNIAVEDNRAVADFYFDFANGAKVMGDVDFGVPEGASVNLEDFDFYFYKMYPIVGSYPVWPEYSEIKLLANAVIHQKDAITTYEYTHIFTFYITLEYDKESGRYELTDDITVRWQDSENENHEVKADANAVMVTDFLENKEQYEQKIALEYAEAKNRYPDKDFFEAGIYIDEEKNEAGYIYTYDKYSVIDDGTGNLFISDGNITRTVEITESAKIGDISDRVYYVHMYTKADGGQIIVCEKEDYNKAYLNEACNDIVVDEKEDGYICIDVETMQLIELEDEYWEGLEKDFTTRDYLFFVHNVSGRRAAVGCEYNFDEGCWQRVYEFEGIQLVDVYKDYAVLRYDGKFVELPWAVNSMGSGVSMNFYTEDVTGDGYEDVIVYWFTREETVYFIYDIVKEKDISPIYMEWEKLENWDDYYLEKLFLHDEHIEVIMNAVNAAYEEARVENVYATTFEEYKEALTHYCYYMTIEWNDEGELIYDLIDREVRVDGVFEYNGEGYDLRIDRVELVTE